MAKLSNGSWVVVADGEKALFLENATDAKDPNLVVVHIEMQDNPPSRDQGTDSPGRAAGTGTSRRSVFQETDWHRLAKDRFAHDLADTLYGLAHRGKFDRLVIVAAPQVLGELRAALHKEVASRIVAEIPKTLTNHRLDEVERIVAAELAAA